MSSVVCGPVGAGACPSDSQSDYSCIGRLVLAESRVCMASQWGVGQGCV